MDCFNFFSNVFLTTETLASAVFELLLLCDCLCRHDLG